MTTAWIRFFPLLAIGSTRLGLSSSTFIKKDLLIGFPVQLEGLMNALDLFLASLFDYNIHKLSWYNDFLDDSLSIDVAKNPLVLLSSLQKLILGC